MDWRIEVGLVILVPITIFGLIRIRKIWAGQDRAMMELGTAALPLSNPVRRGFVRGTVVGILACFAAGDLCGCHSPG